MRRWWSADELVERWSLTPEDLSLLLIQVTYRITVKAENGAFDLDMEQRLDLELREAA